MDLQTIFKPLYSADPELAADFIGKLSEKAAFVLASHGKICVEDIIWGLSQEASFGHAVAHGYIALANAGKTDSISLYHNWIVQFGRKGPALGKVMAEHLVPLLKLNDAFLIDSFRNVIEVMLHKGTYTLYNPLNALDLLCETKDKNSIQAYFDLLKQTFVLELTYKQCRPFTYTLPKAVVSFPPSKRAFQIRQLSRIIQKDFILSDYFLDGLSNGLNMLSEKSLDLFVNKALEKYEKNKKLGAKFLSLGSQMGRDTFLDLQVAVSLSQIRPAIVQYITARTGSPIFIDSLSKLPKHFLNTPDFDPLVCSDGKSIYLPDEISHYEVREKNLALYKQLAKLELGYFEFCTFDFDLEKLQHKIPAIPILFQTAENYVTDFEQFLGHFPHRQPALDLFTVFEHGRIMALTRKRYPGLGRKLIFILRDNWQSSAVNKAVLTPLELLYQQIVLGISDNTGSVSNRFQPVLHAAKQEFDKTNKLDPVVESSAELVFRVYPDFLALWENDNSFQEATWPALNPPFGRKILPQLFFYGIQTMDRKAWLLKTRLEKKGIHIYRSAVRKKLIHNDGSLSLSEIKQLMINKNEASSELYSPHNDRTDPDAKRAFSRPDLTEIMEKIGMVAVQQPEITGPVFYYREWDNRLGDYLEQHTLVHEKEIPCKNDDFYKHTLEQYGGLIKQIRYAFELLKPENITILRQWVEGDEFDYRAMLDFAMDKKAGILPSEKLYIKKIKRQRDVAVLLLVDLSRSTANCVLDSSETVLDVEKQAIVLFCEALQVVGDNYAVAGFSGTGRLGVDYFKIKNFDEALNETIRQRINAMNPQRSTRMGAAIRHATAELEKNNAAVRLMIILGDGFPNDVDYKKDYAIADTRKAILEARSKNIYAHALTVNISADPRLDDLYGNVHHHVISNVFELPVKLPRIYSFLTRY